MCSYSVKSNLYQKNLHFQVLYDYKIDPVFFDFGASKIHAVNCSEHFPKKITILFGLLYSFLLQIIVKEKGVFTNVISPTTKAKLRLLFEVAPLGLLIENAGGYSSDGTQSVLDKVIVNLDDRTQVAYGSKNEIIRFEETLYGSSRLKSGVPVGASA